MRSICKTPLKAAKIILSLFACALLTTTPSMAQDKQVKLSSSRMTILGAIREIESQTEYIVGYNDMKVDVSTKTTINHPYGTTKEVLASLLAGTGLTYEMKGKFIFLRDIVSPVQVVTTESEPKMVPIDQSKDVIGVAVKTITQRIVAEPEPTPEVKPATKPTAPKEYYPATLNLTATPRLAVKTNLLLDATANIALGLELRTSRKTTLDISGGWRLFDAKWPFGAWAESRFRHWFVQPEFRLWTCEAFNGHFFGVHAHYAKYNVGGLKSTLFSDAMNQNRYEGWLAGAGISYGYHWILNKRWSLEGNIGVGWAYLDYDKYLCRDCGQKTGSDTKHYFGPTKAGITLIYTIK